MHPGYGFLAESAAFARACRRRRADVRRAQARAHRADGRQGRGARGGGGRGRAGRARAPTARSPTSRRRWRRPIEYPVAVKAAAGGGGRGIRIAADEAALRKAFAAAAREAGGAFGDDRLYVERFVERARHIEVQVFGDVRAWASASARCSGAGRRSSRRRPAPTYDATGAVRGRGALAGSIGYRGAGTLEFLVDDETGEFFFIEMNTRIQVEHPVTELVTGVDLVAAQLDRASCRRVRAARLRAGAAAERRGPGERSSCRRRA